MATAEIADTDELGIQQQARGDTSQNQSQSPVTIEETHTEA